jgi:hypothetical protein
VLRKRNSDAFSQRRNTEEEYLLKAQQHGFELIEKADITRNILPTLRMIRMAKRTIWILRCSFLPSLSQTWIDFINRQSPECGPLEWSA